MFRWWKKFIEREAGEICDICGKRALRSKAGALVHYSSSGGIYVHSEHLLKSIKDFYDAPWAKKVSKAIKENGEYVMSYQEEAMMSHGGIEGVSSPTEKKDDGMGFLGGLCIGAMLGD